MAIRDYASAGLDTKVCSLGSKTAVVGFAPHGNEAIIVR